MHIHIQTHMHTHIHIYNTDKCEQNLLQKTVSERKGKKGIRNEESEMHYQKGMVRKASFERKEEKKRKEIKVIA